MHYTQPQAGPLSIDWQNPLTRGMVLVWTGAAPDSNQVRPTSTSINGAGLVLKTGPLGRGAGTTATALGRDFFLNEDIPPPFTALAVYDDTQQAAGGVTYRPFDGDNTNTTPGRCFQHVVGDGGGGANFVSFTGFNTAGGAATAKSTSKTKLTNNVSGGSVNAAGVVRCFLNGVQEATNTLTGTPQGLVGTGQGPLTIADRPFFGSDATKFTGTVYLCVFWRRELSAEENKSFYANPWQIFLDDEDEEQNWLRATAGGVSYSLALSAGSFALTGVAAGMSAARRMSASTASFGLTGNAVGLKFGHRLAASAGTYTFAGNAVALSAGRKLLAAAGSYVVTGVAVGLLYGSLGRSLIAVPGSYAWTPSAAALRASRRLQATPGLFSLAAGTVGLALGRRLMAAMASYLISGKPILFGRQQRLAAESSQYQFAGYAVGLTYSAAITYGRAPVGAGYTRPMGQTARPTTDAAQRQSTIQRGNR
jgi:hypothetical protein